MASYPIFNFLMSGYSPIIRHIHVGIQNMCFQMVLIIHDSTLHIQQHSCGRIRIISTYIISGTLCRCHLDIYIRIGQFHLIICGWCRLSRFIICTFIYAIFHISAKREYQYISQIGTTGSIQMILGKSHDRIVCNIKSRTVFPLIVPCFWTCLYKPKWHTCSGKSMSIIGISYKRINKGKHVFISIRWRNIITCSNQQNSW